MGLWLRCKAIAGYPLSSILSGCSHYLQIRISTYSPGWGESLGGYDTFPKTQRSDPAQTSTLYHSIQSTKIRSRLLTLEKEPLYINVQRSSPLVHIRKGYRMEAYLLCSTIPMATASCLASMAISKIFWFLSFTETSCSDLESRYFRISAWPPLAAMCRAVFCKKHDFTIL